MDHDVIVIGGSYAGSAAALQLLRARKRVLVVDAGERRNRSAEASHGFITHDGADPAAVARAARADLEAYPGLTWHQGVATGARAVQGAFEVTLETDAAVTAARLILATGVRDELPDIPGLAARWGKGVAHCPYCHGYEAGTEAIGVIGVRQGSAHQAQLLSDWGPVTYLVQPGAEPDAETMADLTARGVTIEATVVAGIEGHADVRLADGSLRRFGGLFVAPQISATTPLAAQLGCEMDEATGGATVRVDAMQRTSLRGVFACGDGASPMHSVALAVGRGAMAGIAAHQSLAFPG